MPVDRATTSCSSTFPSGYNGTTIAPGYGRRKDGRGSDSLQLCHSRRCPVDQDRISGLKQRLDSGLPHLATKAGMQEVKSDAHTWIVGMGITLLIALGGMQFSFFSLLKSTVVEQMALAKIYPTAPTAPLVPLTKP